MTTYDVRTCHGDNIIHTRVTTDATPQDVILGLRAQGAVGTEVRAPGGEVTCLRDLDPRKGHLVSPVTLPLPVSRSHLDGPPPLLLANPWYHVLRAELDRKRKQAGAAS